MTTRFYLTTTAAPVSTTFSTSWEQTAGAIRGLLGTTPAGTNTAVTVAEVVTTNPYDVLLGQWTSAPMVRGGSLAGTFTFCVARSESNAAADLLYHYLVSVVSANGLTLRGSVIYQGGAEASTTLTAGREADKAIAAITCQAGDRLVFEYGYRATNTVTTSYSATARYGGTSQRPLADLDTGTDATTSPPWIEFTDADRLFSGASFMDDTLGGNALLCVEIAFGADLTQDPASWAWTDVTADVRADKAISTTHARSDEASTTQPASCSFELDNTAGAYSLGGQCPNWPGVRRGTPVRVRADPDGLGFDVLFQGSANGFTPKWDITGRDAVVAVSASGTLRRLAQGKGVVASPFRRAALALPSLVAYWPCEEVKGATAITSALDGGASMRLVGSADADPYPKFADSDTFPCSLPLPMVNLTAWRGTVAPYPLTQVVQTRFLLATPRDPLNGTECILLRIFTSGTLQRWELSYVNAAGGSLKLYVVDSVGVRTQLFYVDVNLDGTNNWWSIVLDQNGGNVDYVVQSVGLGYSVGGLITGSVAGVIAACTAIAVAPDNDVDDAAIGHITVQSAASTFTADLDAYNSYDRELAHVRVARLCAEADVPVTITGTSTVEMGKQSIGALVPLLRECEAADEGLLYDGVGPGLSYLCGALRVNAAASLTLDAAAGQVAREVAPVDDDQRTINSATATRTFGGTATYADVDGPMGTDTIDTYDTSVEINISSSDDIIDYASRRVQLGTVQGYRYPTLQLDLARNPTLAPTWTGITPSDRIDVTNVSTARTQHPVGTLALLVEGYDQTIDQFLWDVTVNVSPYEPWRAGLLSGNTGDTGVNVLRADTDGATLASAAAAAATSLSVATPSGPLWTTVADDLPFDIEVGGIRVTVTAISGAASPQTFTVTGSTVTKALAAGLDVALYRPVTLGI